MSKGILRFCSIILSLVMVFQILPTHVWAQDLTADETVETMVTQPVAEDTYIVGEIEENRTEFSKEFMLNNGLHVAAVYGSPVHYQENGQWEDIDNTLKLATTRSGNVYTNTAGNWQVSFPQSLSASSGVTITKGEYILSFRMAGELRSTGGNMEMDADASAQLNGLQTITAQEVVATVETVDLTAAKEDAAYEQIVTDKLYSRLSYANIYEDTDVIFDLNSNQVKESIVMERYSSTLSGYSYILEPGTMTPVLNESGEILLMDGEEVIMMMPAPFLEDYAGERSYDVDVKLDNIKGTYILAYMLPTEWLADESRQWPVILDPAVTPSSDVNNIKDRTVAQGGDYAYNDGSLYVGYRAADSWSRISHSYLKYKVLPALTSADVIVNATIQLKLLTASSSDTIVEVHKVNGTWESETITYENKPAFNPIVEDFQCPKTVGYHAWNITDIVRGWYEGENTGMMFKIPDAAETAAHNASQNDYKQFYASDWRTQEPIMLITFRNNNGLESYWDYTSSSAGRAGTGYVNHYTGNLVWTRSDLGFGGNLMPVSISHIYNANDSQNNTFGMGYGWRTNFNQRVYKWEDSNAYGDYYVWEDADGTKHYFLKESDGTYKDEDGLELTLTDTGSGTKKYCITDKYGNCSYFDTKGRLTQQTNNQATKSSITITYTSDTGMLISSITDGANRIYSFEYPSGLLSKITYKGNGSSEISKVTFAYTNSELTSITDKDGKSSTYTYTDNHLLSSAKDIDGYKLVYTYTRTDVEKPNRVASITEFSGDTAGGAISITYGHNQTKFVDHNGNEQIVQFNNWGNTVSIQDDQGRAQYARYAINDAVTDSSTQTTASNSTAKGNQLLLASKMQNTVGNVLKDSSFESSTNWTATGSAVSSSVASGTAYYGSKSLKLTRSTAGTAAGVYSPTFTVGKGETYTFSAYVKTGTGSAYLALYDGSATSVSETLPADRGWTRLEVSYTNTSTSSKTVTARLLTADAGNTYMDCVQVEKAPTASRYNLLENGDFRYSGYAWSPSTGRTTLSNGAAPAPQLDANVYCMTGNPSATNRISQTVNVSGDAGDSYILAGWAKGDSVPLEGSREFSMIAIIHNTDGTATTSKIQFNPCADSTIEWQYAASPIVAEKAYSSIQIELAYDYNANTVYFDGIQLYREEYGNSYTYDEDGNLTSVVDLQEKTTTYEYDANQNLTKIIQDNKAKVTYTYDNYHNVKTATTSEGTSYAFAYDKYGNNTAVSIVNGSSSIISYAEYTTDGNRLVSTTDAAGNKTMYSYNANTNVLESVQYPNDTDETKTSYTYDDLYRLATSTATSNTGKNFSATYTYSNDLLTSLATPTTTYTFAYGAFSLRSSVKIGSRTLAAYTYTNDRNNYLASLDYGNGDSVDYTYDKQGRVTKQTYEDGAYVSYQYDNSGALATVYDSASGIKTTYYYDFTDRLIKYTETGTNYFHSVSYTYDEKNNLSYQLENINGTEYESHYTYDDDNRLVEVENDGEVWTLNYESGFGRLSSITGGAFDQQYNYRTTSDGKITNQITSISYSGITYPNSDDTRTYTYTYDANGNITSAQFGIRTVTYEYDSQNQLIKETNEKLGRDFTYTYDNAGNILTETTYVYPTANTSASTSTVSYAYDTGWGDMLSSYGNGTVTRQIAHDEIGNRLSDANRTYTWRNGRELATVTRNGATWTNTYNANGMRTKRTDGTNTYEYIYNGDKLMQMKKNGEVINFTYVGNTPATMTYQGNTFYYVVNAQGDVTGMTNSEGKLVISYTYDAWGRWVYYIQDADWSSVLGGINPLLYRGYVFDHETSLYYLQSRYYDYNTHRFLNADAFAATGQGLLGNNMFAYCGNNPVIRSDETGSYWAAVVASCAMGAATAQDISQLLQEGNISASYTSNYEAVQIANSNKIQTPWVQYGYSFYLNHFSEYKDYFVGSTIGMTFEWAVHNLGEIVFTAVGSALDAIGLDGSDMHSKAVSCEAVDIGPTIFHDNAEKHGPFSYVMKKSYCISYFFAAIYDGVQYLLN